MKIGDTVVVDGIDVCVEQTRVDGHRCGDRLLALRMREHILADIDAWRSGAKATLAAPANSALYASRMSGALPALYAELVAWYFVWDPVHLAKWARATQPQYAEEGA